MHKTRNLWLHRAIIALCAVCCAYAYTARFTVFMGASRTDKLQLLGISLIFLAVIPASLLGPLIICLIKRIPANILIRLVVPGMLLSAAVLGLVSELPPFPEFHSLRINVPGTGSTPPGQNSVHILSIHRIYQPGGERIQVDPSELDLTGEWQVLEDNSLLLVGNQPGSLLFEAFMQAGLEVILQAGPGQGVVQISWDGEGQTLDLHTFQADSVTRKLLPPQDLAKADAARKMLVIGAVFAEFVALASIFSTALVLAFAFRKQLLAVRSPAIMAASSALLLILLLISASTQQQVYFEDPKLEAVIRQALGSKNEALSARQLQTMAVLDASNQGITSLEGIQQLRSLAELNLRGNQISDISPLGELKKLNSLNLRENKINNIEALSHLTNLVYLNLHSNTGITSVIPLAELVNLKTLILRNVPVKDGLGHLANMAMLQRINLRNTGLTSTETLAGLMVNGALQDDPLAGIKAEIDLRDNPLDHDSSDAYAPLRRYWENINSRVPFVLPYYGSLDPPVFSHSAGFYKDGFWLELNAGELAASIHYTLDGSVPTRESLPYTAPIRIQSRKGEPGQLASQYSRQIAPYQITENQLNPAWGGPDGEIFKATVVRARVLDAENGEQSAVGTQTYFVDDNIQGQYTLPVVSLSTNPEYLFGYEYGIYVRGEIYDQFYPQPVDKPWFTPANYYQRGTRWERPLHIEFLEPGGTTGFSEDVAVRIHGGGPRRFPEKSLRIYARSEYGSADVFNYQLFPGLLSRTAVEPLLQFNNFLLQNSGNDWFGTLFRDPLMQSLVEDTSLDTMAYRPVIVFLNGEYWGIHALRQRMDEYYLASMYGLDADNVVIMERNQDLYRGEPGDAKHFSALLKFVGENNPKGQQNYQTIQTLMDVENFIDYQVSEIYFANTDWPGNNVRYWRFVREEFTPDAPPGQDGLWRWMLFDTDHGFGLLDDTGYTHDTLKEAEDIDISSGFLLTFLFENENFKAEFINRLADRLNTSFAIPGVLERVDRMHAELLPEMEEHIRRWDTMQGSIDVWEQNVEVLREFARKRPDILRQQIVERFGLPGTAVLTLQAEPDQGTIQVNSISITRDTPGVQNPDNWSGVYFMGVPIRISAVPNPGYTFAGWEGHEQAEDRIALELTGNLTLKAKFSALP